MDMITSSIHFILFSYLLDHMKLNSYTTTNFTSKNTLFELSSILDKVSESIVMMRVHEKRDVNQTTPITRVNNKSINNNPYVLSLYHCSENFSTKYLENRNYKIIHSPPDRKQNSDSTKTLNLLNSAECLFEKFIYVPREDLMYKSETAKLKFDSQMNSSYNLLNDLNDFVEENYKGISLQSASSSYKKNIYAFKINDLSENDAHYEYFEVKYILFNSSIFSNNENFVLMLFRNINHETYHFKNQQMTAFGNVLISSLTHELKNPLNAIYGQIYSMESEAKMLCKDIDILENILQKEKSIYSDDIEFNYLISEYKTHNDKIPMIIDKLVSLQKNENANGIVNKAAIQAKIKTLILCKFVNYYGLVYNNLRCCKYIISKINLITENFEIFSKLKLKLHFDIRPSEVNLFFLLKKSFKLLYPMVEINNNMLTVDVNLAKISLIKTDPRIFRILIKNILLIFAKRSNKSSIEIYVKQLSRVKKLTDKEDESPSNLILEISFILKDSLQMNFTPKNDINSLDVKDIFRKNIKKLAPLINIDCSEKNLENNNVLKYTLLIQNFTCDPNLNVHDTFSIKNILNFSNSNEYPQNKEDHVIKHPNSQVCSNVVSDSSLVNNSLNNVKMTNPIQISGSENIIRF